MMTCTHNSRTTYIKKSDDVKINTPMQLHNILKCFNVPLTNEKTNLLNAMGTILKKTNIAFIPHFQWRLVYRNYRAAARPIFFRSVTARL